MKCPHCSKDIPEKLIIQEAARISGRKSKRQLTPDQAKKMANSRWKPGKKNENEEEECMGKKILRKFSDLSEEDLTKFVSSVREGLLNATRDLNLKNISRARARLYGSIEQAIREERERSRAKRAMPPAATSGRVGGARYTLTEDEALFVYQRVTERAIEFATIHGIDGLSADGHNLYRAIENAIYLNAGEDQ